MTDEKNYDNLKDYILRWQKNEGIKPKNESKFIDGFIHFIETLDDMRDVSFDGDGAYFGNQVRIGFNSGVWMADPVLNFEIAYSGKKISIYTGRHEGFWTPEYVSMKVNDSNFDKLMKPFVQLLNKAFGLAKLNQKFL